jgi:hypothetical protein
MFKRLPQLYERRWERTRRVEKQIIIIIIIIVVIESEISAVIIFKV